MGFFYYTWTLVKKTLLIVSWRHFPATAFRALILPIVYIALISSVRQFFLPPAQYGFGDPRPIRNITRELFNSVPGHRDRVVLVNNGHTNGLIEDVINGLSQTFSQAGAIVRIVSQEDELFTECKSSLRGSTRCYGAVSFRASPTEGSGGLWDYLGTIDLSLGFTPKIDRNDNDAQIFSLPFVHAIDSQIALVSGKQLPQGMLEYPFTDNTNQDREDQIHSFFMSAITRYLAPAFFVAVCGITYHLPGFIAWERELGMSQLIDAMMPKQYQWQPPATRLLSVNAAFTMIYLPSFIVIGVILSTLVFLNTSPATVVLFHVASCLSLSGYSTFCGTWFRKAQLSGIMIVVGSLFLAAVTQLVFNFLPIILFVLIIIFPPINYTSFIISIATWERDGLGANLFGSTYGISLPGYLHFIASLVHIVLFQLLAIFMESLQYNTTSSSRMTTLRLEAQPYALRLEKISKVYKVGWLSSFNRRQNTQVHAVQDVSVNVVKGQIVALLGANGSGKSTTISAISGLEKVSSGLIQLDGTAGLGLCPQKNVLWDELTVREHVNLFSRLKGKTTVSEVDTLVYDCDLEPQKNRQSKTLSGGQKRKLQLAIAFAGGSKLCCIDEASSGLDPVSRRKIWDIMLSERGRRTLLFTTHALDEADALSDCIVILSKGTIRLQGSAAALKQRFGGGYRIQLHELDAEAYLRATQGSQGVCKNGDDKGSYHLSSPAELSSFIETLESIGVTRYNLAGPSIETVFLNEAEEGGDDLYPAQLTPISTVPKSAMKNIIELQEITRQESMMEPLLASRSENVGFAKQTWILLQKRILILRRSYWPYLFAILIPSLTAGLTVNAFLQGFSGIDCSAKSLARKPQVANLSSLEGSWGLEIPLGPADRFSESVLDPTFGLFASQFVNLSNTFDEFQAFVRDHYRFVVPGGLYVDSGSNTLPLMAYRINGGLEFSAVAKSTFDSLLINTTIQASFSTFSLPLPPNTGDTLQLTIYFGLAMAAYPGIFALYPSYERLRNIKALNLSNGIHPGPQWLAHLIFDLFFVTVISVVTLVIFVTASSVWYAPGHLFVVFVFYGIASTVLSYAISLLVSSQLGAFALAVGTQAVSLLVYFLGYFALAAFSSAEDLGSNLNTFQSTLGLLTPSGNLLRALLLSLNQSQLLCRNQAFAGNPGAIGIYGGPILYLVLQTGVLYGTLVAADAGLLASVFPVGLFKNSIRHASEGSTEGCIPGKDVAAEVRRTETSDDGLRVVHVVKSFGGRKVVNDLTFGVKHGEAFALLGPNGAGKSTTISLIRGNLVPEAGDVLVEGVSTRKRRTDAQRALGVCPQFDAIDRMTVAEHLRFYARAAGILDVEDRVSNIISSVGLDAYRNRMAEKLSGGNKRKLSLGIAVIGNPKILLLDEPSSGMDAISQRLMWQALTLVNRGRSMVITSHSMEEVAALADRVGIMAKRMLLVGEKEELLRRYGDRYHVHLALRKEDSDDQSAARAKAWVVEKIRGAVFERAALHGQLRFSIPKATLSNGLVHSENNRPVDRSSLGFLLKMLERYKAELNLEYYSIGENTLEDMFLRVIGHEPGVLKEA